MAKNFKNERHLDLTNKFIQKHFEYLDELGNDICSKMPIFENPRPIGWNVYKNKKKEYLGNSETREYSKSDLPYCERVLINRENRPVKDEGFIEAF